MRRRLPLVGAAALAALVVGALAYLVLAPKPSSSPDRVATNHGEAGTAMDRKVGFSVDVDSMDRGVSVSGSTYLILTVTFHNTSDVQQRADPLDFRVQVADRTRGPIFVA